MFLLILSGNILSAKKTRRKVSIKAQRNSTGWKFPLYFCLMKLALGNKLPLRSQRSHVGSFSSGGLILKQDLVCCGTFSTTNALGVGILEVVPSSSGLAELDLRFEEVATTFILYKNSLYRCLSDLGGSTGPG